MKREADNNRQQTDKTLLILREDSSSLRYSSSKEFLSSAPNTKFLDSIENLIFDIGFNLKKIFKKQKFHLKQLDNSLMTSYNHFKSYPQYCKWNWVNFNGPKMWFVCSLFQRGHCFVKSHFHPKFSLSGFFRIF